MFAFEFLSILFLGVHLIQWIDAGRDDLINDPNLGPLPPHPREKGSKVPPDWQWKTVLVDDLVSNDPHVQDRAGRVFQENTLNSIFYGQERDARNEYEAKEREHIRQKQQQYNENMKKQWKKDRMKSLPSRCKISR